MATYCSILDVKGILHIDEEDVEFDEEIKEARLSAQALIDTRLEAQNITVPSPVPQAIKDATKFFAAWIMRKTRDPPGAVMFLNEAENFLNAYLSTSGEIGFVIGCDET